MTDRQTLKCCPFCGGEVEMWNGQGTQADIRCSECDIGFEFQVTDYCSYEVRFADGNEFNMETLSYPDEVKAPCIAALIKAWNTRAVPDYVKPLVEALREVRRVTEGSADSLANAAWETSHEALANLPEELRG